MIPTVCEPLLSERHVHHCQEFPRLLIGLRRGHEGDIHSLELQNLEPSTHVAQQPDADRATAILVFRHANKPVSLGLPVRWIRVADQWYAMPLTRTPTVAR